MSARRLRTGASIAVALVALGTAWAKSPPSTAARASNACDGAAVATTAASTPIDLDATGLFADATHTRPADGVLSFTPQYPLWSDGAAKRRWIRLPRGTSIDASDPDHWVFPVGTRLWKEFSFGRRVETRLIERVTEREWSFATYVWNEDGSKATLAPARGVRGACESRPGVRYDVPGVIDCGSCHLNRASVVLGFSALQLSGDRDPLAPHAETPGEGDVDLARLVERGLVRNLPRSFVETPPRIAAPSSTERAVVGYLHANCGACHASSTPLASLGLDLEYSIADAARGTAPAATRTTISVVSSSSLRTGAPKTRVVPGHPETSVLWERLATTNPYTRMPPLGVHVVDDEGAALVERWIRSDLAPKTAPESTPR